MRKLYGFLFLAFFPMLHASAQDAVGASTVTLGVGGGKIVGNPQGIDGGPAFNGTYEYRLFKYLSLEAGVDSTLTTSYYYPAGRSASILSGANLIYLYDGGGSSFAYRAGSRTTSVPFGFRGILPLAHGRVELSGGGGGAYFWNSNPSTTAWAVQATLGARVAVDKQRHFWLGTTGRFSHEFGFGVQDWVTWTADLGFRFGR